MRRVGLLMIAHVALVIVSVFIMDWVVRERDSADLWAVSRCTDLLCVSRPLDDGHATTTIWQTLLFSALVLVQCGSRTLGGRARPWLTSAGFMVGAVGAMSVALMAAMFARGSGLTNAPIVLGVAYVLGFVALARAVRGELSTLATARRVDSARASRRV
jgi:hypothetical protein